MKFYKSFDQWSDALDRKAKQVKVSVKRVSVRKVEGGYVAKIGKVQIGTFSVPGGGYVY
jgi:hypothetical protein